MPWKEMLFKGTRVVVETDEAGRVLVAQNRARMKYRCDGDRLYSPSLANLVPTDCLPFETIAVSPDETAPHAQAPSRQRASKDAAQPGRSAASAIIAFTDGACIGNPGPAGIGYLVVFPDGKRIQRGEPLGQATNNIAELSAIGRVLDIAGAADGPLVIHCDSAYAIGVLTAGWKAKANQDLVAGLRHALRGAPGAVLRKVLAHTGVVENELVDRLARRAAETQQSVDDP